MATKAELAAEVYVLRAVAREYEDFKERVREKAIEVANEQDWCRTGLNETLEDLNLPKVPSSRKRTSTIKVTYTFDGDGDGDISRLTILDSNWGEYEVEEWTVEEGDTEDIFDDD